MSYDDQHMPPHDGQQGTSLPANQPQTMQPGALTTVPPTGQVQSFQRTRRPSKLNMVRLANSYFFCYGMTDKGARFLIPRGCGKALVFDSGQIAPFIKKLVADDLDLAISDSVVRTALEILSQEEPERIKVSSGRTWLGSGGERYIMFFECVMMWPAGQENMVRPNFYWPVWLPSNANLPPFLVMQGPSAYHPSGVRVIDSVITLPEHRNLLIYTYMVLLLMPERRQLALELTGVSQSGKSLLLHIIKSLVDPTSTGGEIREVPTTAKEVDSYARQHHVLNFHNVEVPLTQAAQRRFYEFLEGARLNLSLQPKPEATSHLVVSRACTFSCLEPVVTHRELSERTLSLEMPSSSTTRISRPDHEPEERFLLVEEEHNQVMSGLLGLLGKAHAEMDTVTLVGAIPDGWHDFCRIGVIISRALYGSDEAFWSQFEAYRNDRLCERIEQEPVAMAMQQYVLINNLTEVVEKSVAQWQAELEPYRPAAASDREWPQGPREFGAAFKRSVPLLKENGIACYSNGKRGSRCYWAVGPASTAARHH